ncbi:MAG TPA: hypothetical protein VFQ17_11960 [Nocardioides sp.]|jgi:hypothetical protein|nr:hypothetical protein [Nocardioides sp.]
MRRLTSYAAAGLLVVCAVGGTHAAGVAIFARGGSDMLAGTAHHDVLNGGPGFDTVEETPGDDRCISLERVIDGPC